MEGSLKKLMIEFCMVWGRSKRAIRLEMLTVMLIVIMGNTGLMVVKDMGEASRGLVDLLWGIKGHKVGMDDLEDKTPMVVTVVDLQVMVADTLSMIPQDGVVNTKQEVTVDDQEVVLVVIHHKAMEAAKATAKVTVKATAHRVATINKVAILRLLPLVVMDHQQRHLELCKCKEMLHLRCLYCLLQYRQHNQNHTSSLGKTRKSIMFSSTLRWHKTCMLK